MDIDMDIDLDIDIDLECCAKSQAHSKKCYKSKDAFKNKETKSFHTNNSVNNNT